MISSNRLSALLGALWPMVLCGALPEPPHGAIDASAAPLDFRAIIKHARERVFPALVFVKCIRQGHETGRRQAAEVAGSGVLISPRGECLTNWHVVEKTVEIRCLLLDGRALPARLLGSDKDADLALLELQVPPGEEVPWALLGRSEDLVEGDFVMAMGAPWGLSRSVSLGIVSCTRRYLPESSEYSLWLQTDAAISPGNSGGPLVNTAGEVVGLSTLGSMMGGDMGFAVPAATIRELLPRLREHGQVRWSWTGLQFQPLQDFSRNMYFNEAEGVMVAGTDEGSPARLAGIQTRDRIVRVAGHPITARFDEDLPALRRLLGLLPTEAPVTIDVVRGGEALAVQVTPRHKGQVEGQELDCPRWDLTLKEINQFDNPDLYFYCKKGVYVFGLKTPGNAQMAGLMRGDIIQDIDGRPVTSLQEAAEVHRAALQDMQSRRRIILAILRGGLTRQVVLDYGRDFERH
jgi:serine protease Do